MDTIVECDAEDGNFYRISAGQNVLLADDRPGITID
jgi:hypothetical protein